MLRIGNLKGATAETLERLNSKNDLYEVRVNKHAGSNIQPVLSEFNSFIVAIMSTWLSELEDNTCLGIITVQVSNAPLREARNNGELSA